MRASKNKLKRAICLFLIAILNINTFGAIVSDNDGSAFITKKEFDALKSSFRSQIDEYNTSIDSKIDGAIAAYLSGISLTNTVNIEPLFYQNYSLPFTFHNDDEFLDYQHSDSKIINGPSIKITHYMIVVYGGYNGASLSILIFYSPKISEYNYIVKAEYENGIFRFLNESNNYSDNWDFITSYSTYNITPNITKYVSYAWFLSNDSKKINLNPNGGFALGKSGEDYIGTSETTSSYYSLSQIISKSQSYGHTIKCDSNMGTRIDSGDFSNLISHNFINNELIPKYVDFDNKDYSLEYKIGSRWSSTWTSYDVRGNASGTSYVKPTWQFSNIYAPTFAHTNSENESSIKSSAIYANNLYKQIKLYDDIKIDINFMDAVFLHCIEEDVKKFSFTISLDGNNDEYSKLILSKELFDGTNVPNSSIEFYHNDNKNLLKEVNLQHGKEHIITINEPEKLTKIFFKLIPTSGKNVTINNISNCFYEVDV